MYKYLSTSPSTNQYCLENLESFDKDALTVVYTSVQTSGRGQIGRKWYCGEGLDLATSFVYFPQDLKAIDQFQINLLFSLSMREAIQNITKQETLIKWPNDIYIGDRKVAGILIQNMIRGEQIKATVMGIGLNVNTRSFPEDLPNPISVSQIIETDLNIVEVLHSLAHKLCHSISHQRDPAQMKNDFEQEMYGLKVKRQFKIDEHIVEGVILGIHPSGRLKVEIDGVERQFGFREIQLVI